MKQNKTLWCLPSDTHVPVQGDKHRQMANAPNHAKTVTFLGGCDSSASCSPSHGLGAPKIWRNEW